MWRGAVVVAGLAALAAIVAYQESRPPGPVFVGAGPRPFAVRSGGYGPPIKLPAAALTTARTFLQTAVLRKDPAASWDLVTPRLRAGFTQATWAKGNIPVTPFPAAAFATAKFQVSRSRAHDILLKVAISSSDPTIEAAYDYLEMVPNRSGWVVSYFAPVGMQPPLPTSQ